MRRTVAVALLALLATAGASALAGHKAAYAAGTIARFNTSGQRIEGRVDIEPQQLVFVPDESGDDAEPLRIDYASVQHLELGQRASRRLPLIIGTTAVLGPFGLMSLRARSRAHYLTIVYADDRRAAQVVVLELGKDVVHSALAAIEARAGVSVEYQDEEARKWRR